MAKNQNKEIETTKKVEEVVHKYKGSQLVKDDRFNHRVGRIVLDEDKYYSLEEAENAVNDYMRKKG